MTTPIAQLPAEFRPLYRSEYDRLVDLGVFDDVPVELVGGVLVRMSPMKPPHYGLVLALNKRLVLAAGDDYVVGAQGPLAVDEISEPQPDFAILPTGVDYHAVLPEEAFLVIEVSHSSLAFDLGEKARRYAMAGYPEYWVFDVAARVVHVHRDPQPDGTWGSVIAQSEGTLQAVAAPRIVLVLDMLLR